MVLAGAALAASVSLGFRMRIFSAVRVVGWIDSFGTVFANLGLAMPSFWIYIMFVLIFAVNFQWLAVQDSRTFKHIIMPAVALGSVFTAANMRLARSAMLEVLGSEYIKLARIKGLPENLVIFKHAFKNAVIPVLTFACINFALILQGLVVVDLIFAWSGIGRLLVEGISSRDFPVVQATVILGGVMIIIVNLLVDILYAYIDPRIRYGQ